MLNYTTPEKLGISSANIEEYIRTLEESQLSMHDMIISKGNDICLEAYWKPFSADYLHRMYSVSKSFVSLAIGFLEQDGRLSLDDYIVKYFPDETINVTDENVKQTTIRHMLMMSTAKTECNWFCARTDDRVRFYFENDDLISRPSGAFFEYDSSGSFILCALVERLTGQKLMEYLREKLFDKIGVSKEAYCLNCPGGHSWGDSGILCTARDLWLVARFVLNKGKWEGQQILNEEYMRKATSAQISNNPWQVCDYNTHGYGYQFWMTYQEAFFFNGMGCQFAICVPGKDLIMVCNADNQGKDSAKKIIIDNFFRLIVNQIADEEITENVEDVVKLKKMKDSLKLAVAKGAEYSVWEEKINGNTYQLKQNAMEITEIKLCFEKGVGILDYVNAQGRKILKFGMGYNEFGTFPQEGYSDMVGSVSEPGHYYQCAASGAWVEPHKLLIRVQIIDTYFGNVNMIFSFQDEKITIFMVKSAEDFLEEYQGNAWGIQKRRNI